MTAVNSKILFQNAPDFVATGRGLANKLPDYPATQANSNGVLINRALAAGDKNSILPIFVYIVETSFAVSGDTGQSAGARTFYPHNLSQDTLTITGGCANQYEYDRLVEFIRAHQISALNTWADDPNAGQGPSNTALEFQLKPYIVDTGQVDKQGNPIQRTIYGGLPGAGQVGPGNGAKVQGFVASMNAGHQRFIQAPMFSLPFTVTYDFINNPVDLQGELYRVLYRDYMTTFGQLYGRTKQGALIPGAYNTGTPDGFSTDQSGTTDDFWGNQLPGGETTGGALS